MYKIITIENEEKHDVIPLINVKHIFFCRILPNFHNA